MDPLRIGLLGCGRVAQRIHLPILRRMGSARVTALADVNRENLARARDLVPECETYGSAEALFTHPNLDAVLIALPSGQHARAARTAIQSGLHVYVEKPLALGLEEADEVIAAASVGSRTLRVGLNYRFLPAIRELRRSIRDGELGAVIGVQTCFASPSRTLPEWKRHRASGGGALLDLGVHHLDLLTFLLEEAPTEVMAHVRSRDAEQDVAEVTLRFDRIDAQVLVALGAAQTDRIEVLGTAGRARWDRFVSSPIVSFPVQRDHSLAGRFRECLRGVAPLYSSLTHLVRPRREPSYEAALKEFVEAARGGAGDPHAATAEVGRAALALVLAAEEAAACGRAVAL